MLLKADSFQDAVDFASKTKLTSPCYMILGGIRNNEGVVLTRAYDKLDHAAWLTEPEWFQVQTNRDIYVIPDRRWRLAFTYMNDLGYANIAPDGKSIIEKVLWQPGVLEPITIFTSTISAGYDTQLATYDPPSLDFV